MIPVLWSFTWVILLDINVTMQISRIPLIPILRFFHEWNLNESVVGQDNFSSRRLWWKPNYIFTNLRILTIAVRPVHLRSQCEIFAKRWRFSGSCKWSNFSSRRLWWKPNYIFTNVRILTIAVRPVHLRSQCEIFAKHWRFSGSCKWSPKVMVPSMVRYICLWFLSPLGWLKETKPSKNQSGCTWRNVGQNL